jgi:GWxTD domain-containing protein
MGIDNNNFLSKSILIVFVIMLSSLCSPIIRMKQDLFYKSFFEKAQLIMTKEEIEIYRRLPDEKSKQEFIEEFWRIRDPDPGTIENQAKQEFEERVKYANRWFWPFSQVQDPAKEPDNDMGWNTDKGRMYIILGPPDYAYIGGFTYRFDEIRDRYWDRGSQEVWYFERYQLALRFFRGYGGRWTLDSSAPGLLSAIETAKLNLIAPGYIEDAKTRLKFQARFEDNTILVFIPVTRINFEGEEGILRAEFRVRINVYHSHKKIDGMEELKRISESEDELIEKKNIILEFPYTPTLKGSYYFDIIVEDLLGKAFSKYRNFIKYKR